MTNKLTKYGFMIIAAVLLAAMVFAGAASADGESYTAAQWNALENSTMITLNGTVYIVDSNPDAVIYPKYNDLTADPKGFLLGDNLVLDFTDYQGTFSGDTMASTEGIGSLFGYVNLGTVSEKRTLTIKNLTMRNVKMNATSGGNVGGIVGYFKGYSSSYSILNFTNCTLENCSITGTSGSACMGGLAGDVDNAMVIVEDSKAIHCDIVAGGNYIGGLVSRANKGSFLRCNVTNCTVASTGKAYVGGMVGNIRSSSANFEMCGVENTLVYAGGKCSDGGSDVGGLAGYAKYPSFECCTVKNCVIAGIYGEVGGLIGDSNQPITELVDCHLVNCTVVGAERVGGLVGIARTPCSGWIGNSVVDSAINGTGGTVAYVRFVWGSQPEMENPENCTVSEDCFINNNSIHDIITLSSPLNSEFWHTFSWADAENTSVLKPQRTVTSLGQYGKIGGYGFIPTYRVIYDANGATIGTAPKDSNSPYVLSSSATVLGNTGGLAKVGFTFSGWNKDSTTGQRYTASETFTITADTTFYANWTGNPYAVSFDANGGAGSMAPQDFVYGEAPKKLSSNTFTRAGYSFAGWSTSPNGGVIYTDNQSVQNLAFGGTVPLYAVWTDKEFTVTVYLDTVNGTAPYAVKLMRGNETIKENLSVPFDMCEFTAIPKGTYDIVAEDSGAFKKIVTSIVTIATQDEDVYITFPVNNVSSEVIVSTADNTPAVVVGGLDKEAEANAVSSHNVTMTLTVQAKDELSGDTNATIAITAIKDNTTDSVVKEDMQFLDINVNKTVDTVTYSVNETTELIEIVVPYDFTGKDQITVSRYHEGAYQSLTEIFSVADKADGTFRLDRTNGIIYIYAKKFSMYSIGYTAAAPAPQYTPSSSHNTGSTVILPEGQVAPTQQPTAAPTAQPTQKPVAEQNGSVIKPTANPTTTPQTPAPFAGLVLGLGAAAVLLRLRN